jgi:hypothetical protein
MQMQRGMIQHHMSLSTVKQNARANAQAIDRAIDQAIDQANDPSFSKLSVTSSWLQTFMQHQ